MVKEMLCLPFYYLFHENVFRTLYPRHLRFEM